MSRRPDLDSHENCVCFQVRRASRAISQFFTARLDRHGILPTQTPILGLLAARPGAGMGELSEELGLDRTTLVRNLRPLAREGLVKSGGGGRGGRVTLALTAKGRAALHRLEPDWRDAQRTALATLGAARWAEILADLKRVAAALKA